MDNNGRVAFIFAFSPHNTKRILDGSLPLKKGGVRNENGAAFMELGQPIFLDNGGIDLQAINDISIDVQSKLFCIRDMQIESKVAIEQLKNNTMLMGTILKHMYVMTFEGFSQVLQNLNTISNQISAFEAEYTANEESKRIEQFCKFKLSLNSAADYLYEDEFSTSSAHMYITPILDEIAAFLDVGMHRFKANIGNKELLISSMISLIQPYAYVVRRYSALYYLKKGHFPANYDNWIKPIAAIAKTTAFYDHYHYMLRVNGNLPLLEAHSLTKHLRNQVVLQIRQIETEKLYLPHINIDDYLNQEKTILKNYDPQNPIIIKNRLCIPMLTPGNEELNS